jgi:hypothetical protein
MCVVHSRFNHSSACQLLDSSVKEPIAGVIFSTSLCTQFSSLALLYCKLFTLRSRPLPVQAQPDVCLRGHRRWYRGANFVCERVSRKSKHPEAGKRSEIMRGVAEMPAEIRSNRPRTFLVPLGAFISDLVFPLFFFARPPKHKSD